ncbi:hypothetical protein [Novosphingobium sp.]|uniref:hypothetical protein n=1 Tax=Novosphingobium sp. TaxID=1874826 RepID=UPI00333EEB81
MIIRARWAQQLAAASGRVFGLLVPPGASHAWPSRVATFIAKREICDITSRRTIRALGEKRVQTSLGMLNLLHHPSCPKSGDVRGDEIAVV